MIIRETAESVLLNGLGLYSILRNIYTSYIFEQEYHIRNNVGNIYNNHINGSVRMLCDALSFARQFLP